MTFFYTFDTFSCIIEIAKQVTTENRRKNHSDPPGAGLYVHRPQVHRADVGRRFHVSIGQEEKES